MAAARPGCVHRVTVVGRAVRRGACNLANVGCGGCEGADVQADAGRRIARMWQLAPEPRRGQRIEDVRLHQLVSGKFCPFATLLRRQLHSVALPQERTPLGAQRPTPHCSSFSRRRSRQRSMSNARRPLWCLDEATALEQCAAHSYAASASRVASYHELNPAGSAIEGEAMRRLQRQVVAASAMVLASFGSTPTLALTCTSAAPIEFDGTGFVANASLERLEVRSGRPGSADWKWGLGANTQQAGSFALSYTPNWVSGKVFDWTLTLDAAGNGTISVRDPAGPIFSKTFTANGSLQVRTGNALRFYAKSTADAGSATVAATVTAVNGLPISIALGTPGNSQFSEINRYVFFPALKASTTVSGTVRLTYGGTAPPSGSRLNFIVWAGNVQCDAAGTPPTVVNPIPADGTVLPADSVAPISAAFQAGSAPIDATTARLLVDGADVSATAVVTASGIAYTPPQPLTEGTHQVSVSIDDQGGRSTSLTWTYVTRTPPEVQDATPQGTTTTNTRPRVAVRMSDIGSGIDPTSARLLMNGADVTAEATVSAGEISYVPATPLPQGTQSVALTVRDKAGNSTSRAWSFRILVPAPTPPLAGDRGSIEAPTLLLPAAP